MLKKEVGNDTDTIRCLFAVANIVKKTQGTAYIESIQRQMSVDALGRKKNEAKMKILWQSCLEVFKVDDIYELSKGQRAIARLAVAKVALEYPTIPKVKLALEMDIKYQSLNRLQREAVKPSDKIVQDVIAKIKTRFNSKYNKKENGGITLNRTVA